MPEQVRAQRTLEHAGAVHAIELEAEGTSATFRIDGRGGSLCWLEGADGRMRVHWGEHSTLAYLRREGDTVWVHLDGSTHRFTIPAPGARPRAGHASGPEPEVRAPMTGTVRRIQVHAGQKVEKGQPLLALEAMKMEHLLKAPAGATVETILCREGETVDLGSVLLRLELDPAP